MTSKFPSSISILYAGVVAESPKRFIQGIMSFDKRKQWESKLNAYD